MHYLVIHTSSCCPWQSLSVSLRYWRVMIHCWTGFIYFINPVFRRDCDAEQIQTYGRVHLIYHQVPFPLLHTLLAITKTNDVLQALKNMHYLYHRHSTVDNRVVESGLKTPHHHSIHWPVEITIVTQVRMYYGSGTGRRCCISVWQTLRMHSPGGSTFCKKWRHGRHLVTLTSYQKSDSINRCVYNPTKFHSDAIWNDEALGFLELVAPIRRRTRRRTRTRWVTIWHQFLI